MNDKTVEYDVMQPQKDEVDVVMKELEKTGRMEYMKQCIQHGNISVYEHCVRVAVMSLVIAELFKITVDRRSLIVGALRMIIFYMTGMKKMILISGMAFFIHHGR